MLKSAVAFLAIGVVRNDGEEIMWTEISRQKRWYVILSE